MIKEEDPSTDSGRKTKMFSSGDERPQVFLRKILAQYFLETKMSLMYSSLWKKVLQYFKQNYD